MEWKIDVVELNKGWARAIVDVQTKSIVADVDNLDGRYIERIIDSHNKAISLARKDGVEIMKEIYKGSKEGRSEL